MVRNQPLVTVIVSVFNKEEYVSEAIESVIKQTYSYLDILVVDDGSNDGSSGMIQACKGRDPRIRAFSQSNSGVASCRNRGLTDSESDFIIFLDGDDLLYPDYVEKAVQYMVAHPSVDLLHVGWDNIDEAGRLLSSVGATAVPDYLHSLLLGNMFAIHAVLCRTAFLKNRVGLFNFYTVTDDWEYWIRCAKSGGRFQALDERLVATRQYPGNNKKIRAKQRLRFFPIIDKVFSPEFGLPEEYRRLEQTSRVRHHFYLMQNYAQWGWADDAAAEFTKALLILRTHTVGWREIAFVLPTLALGQMARITAALARRRAYRQVMGIWVGRYTTHKAVRMMAKSGRWVARRGAATIRRAVARIEAAAQRSQRLIVLSGEKPYSYHQGTAISDVRRLSLEYVERQRVVRHGRFGGYLHSASTTRPVLYATVFALLIKHLYCAHGPNNDEELEHVLKFQGEDGWFRDPAIDCPGATSYHGWGWRHLTLHVLMTLALYDRPLRRELPLRDPYDEPDRFHRFLDSRDWSGQAAATGNELQNLGVYLQYSRDYQGSARAGQLLEVMYDVIDQHQDPASGLYGDSFVTPEQLSKGVMSAYHLWLLYFYDQRPIPHVERAIDSLLMTQNIMGGYGVRWNSSACEDIDSIDPLVRFSQLTSYRRADIQASLQRGLPAVLRNLNGDGGWVFRRHEPRQIIHPQMFSAKDESNMFYSWFRTLGLAYLLSGLDEPPPGFRYHWAFKRAPGHQFLVHRVPNTMTKPKEVAARVNSSQS